VAGVGPGVAAHPTEDSLLRVVHQRHGVGRLVVLSHAAENSDCAAISAADDETLGKTARRMTVS
jgi:hypothetical protein